jgi:hypothetical protein
VFGQHGLGDKTSRFTPFHVTALQGKNVVKVYTGGDSNDGFSFAVTGIENKYDIY